MFHLTQVNEYAIFPFMRHSHSKGDFMMPTIRIEDDVFQGLKSLAEPFTDTPNTVIRRLLVGQGALSNVAQNPTNVRQFVDVQKSDAKSPEARKGGSLTPQPVYEEFLLYVLGTRFNGSAGKHEATQATIELLRSHGFIGPADLKRVTTGETKAENTIAWARNALKDRGLISRLASRGIWELTPDGIASARRIALRTKGS
jgi:hypothetical protein